MTLHRCAITLYGQGSSTYFQLQFMKRYSPIYQQQLELR
jgi:hypothetical protein